MTANYNKILKGFPSFDTLIDVGIKKCLQRKIHNKNKEKVK